MFSSVCIQGGLRILDACPQLLNFLESARAFMQREKRKPGVSSFENIRVFLNCR